LASEEFNDTRVAVLHHLPRFLKKSKIAASSIHACSIFKKEIRDPMMYVILLLITIILFLAIFLREYF
jgi:hypothetical protein